MRKWMPLALLALAVAISITLAPFLPETMTVHWNWRGEPDGFAPKWVGLIGLPIVMAMVLLVLHLLPRLDPMRDNYRKFWPEYQLMMIAVAAMVAVIHVAILAAAMGYEVRIIRIALIGIGILFVVIGNVMPRLRRNHTAGFRTKATLASDMVWARTHRFGGAVMVATGILIAVSAFAPAEWGIPVLLILVLLMCAAIAVYSNRLARSQGRNGSTQSAK